MRATVSGVIRGIVTGDTITKIEIVWITEPITDLQTQASAETKKVTLNAGTDDTAILNFSNGTGTEIKSSNLILGNTYTPATRITKSRNNGADLDHTGQWTQSSSITVAYPILNSTNERSTSAIDKPIIHETFIKSSDVVSMTILDSTVIGSISGPSAIFTWSIDGIVIIDGQQRVSPYTVPNGKTTMDIVISGGAGSGNQAIRTFTDVPISLGETYSIVLGQAGTAGWSDNGYSQGGDGGGGASTLKKSSGAYVAGCEGFSGNDGWDGDYGNWAGGAGGAGDYPGGDGGMPGGGNGGSVNTITPIGGVYSQITTTDLSGSITITTH